MKNDIVFHSVNLSNRIALQRCLDVARRCGLPLETLKAESAVVEDYLVIRACCFGSDKRFYLQPLYVGGTAAFKAEMVVGLLQLLRAYSCSVGEAFRMAFLDRDFVAPVGENPNFYVYENPDYDAWFLMDKASDEYKIWKLWQEAFADSDSFLASYIYPYSTPDARILFYEDDDPQKDVVAMCHVHYFDSDFGLAAYLYALAVSKKARGRGLGTIMVKKILERAQANGAKLLWAVQGNLDYNAWEHSLGFFAPRMDVSELDFGNEFMQDSFGVEPGEISDERALVKCFDAETEKAVRFAKPPFKLKFRD